MSYRPESQLAHSVTHLFQRNEWSTKLDIALEHAGRCIPCKTTKFT